MKEEDPKCPKIIPNHGHKSLASFENKCSGEISTCYPEYRQPS